MEGNKTDKLVHEYHTLLFEKARLEDRLTNIKNIYNILQSNTKILTNSSEILEETKDLEHEVRKIELFGVKGYLAKLKRTDAFYYFVPVENLETPILRESAKDLNFIQWPIKLFQIPSDVTLKTTTQFYEEINKMKLGNAVVEIPTPPPEKFKPSVVPVPVIKLTPNQLSLLHPNYMDQIRALFEHLQTADPEDKQTPDSYSDLWDREVFGLYAPRQTGDVKGCLKFGVNFEFMYKFLRLRGVFYFASTVLEILRKFLDKHKNEKELLRMLEEMGKRNSEFFYDAFKFLPHYLQKCYENESSKPPITTEYVDTNSIWSITCECKTGESEKTQPFPRFVYTFRGSKTIISLFENCTKIMCDYNLGKNLTRVDENHIYFVSYKPKSFLGNFLEQIIYEYKNESSGLEKCINLFRNIHKILFELSDTLSKIMNTATHFVPARKWSLNDIAVFEQPPSWIKIKDDEVSIDIDNVPLNTSILFDNIEYSLFFWPIPMMEQKEEKAHTMVDVYYRDLLPDLKIKFQILKPGHDLEWDKIKKDEEKEGS